MLTGTGISKRYNFRSDKPELHRAAPHSSKDHSLSLETWEIVHRPFHKHHTAVSPFRLSWKVRKFFLSHSMQSVPHLLSSRL